MAIEISNEAPVQSWGGSWWSVAWAGQHVGSCVSWGVQPADCRWHCSDHMHRFVETRVEKHGWLLFTGTEKNFEIISASLKSNLKCALPVQAHFTHGHEHLLVDELRLSLSLHLLTLRYQLKGGGMKTRDERDELNVCGVKFKCVNLAEWCTSTHFDSKFQFSLSLLNFFSFSRPNFVRF